jgi:hypothetical protein
MGRLWMVGEAIGRNVTAGHRPGHGPTDEDLTEIAANICAASDRAGRVSVGASDPGRQASIEHARSQVMHTCAWQHTGRLLYYAPTSRTCSSGNRRLKPMTERGQMADSIAGGRSKRAVSGAMAHVDGGVGSDEEWRPPDRSKIMFGGCATNLACGSKARSAQPEPTAA